MPVPVISQDDFIWFTSQAARVYQVSEHAIAEAAARLEPSGHRRHAQEICELHIALINVAAAHQWCRAGCETCVAIRESITVAMAVLRTEVDSQLEQMIDGPARGVALPTAASWQRPAAGAVYRSENP
ncbi:hypothetical protein [Actinoplanes aureus]|uniref:Uncharacterized protein n=1 Tax=Actinoplanes aureus TaxID=2792083 RepID=A0A931FYR3_9ACTN|nr:hypothetical protein [Actinoplanes aureus]MBG0562186.1 hypothetical protein [Actinoplanes aureus]